MKKKIAIISVIIILTVVGLFYYNKQEKAKYDNLNIEDVIRIYR